jgi:hypothetical protein
MKARLIFKAIFGLLVSQIQRSESRPDKSQEGREREGDKGAHAAGFLGLFLLIGRFGAFMRGFVLRLRRVVYGNGQKRPWGEHPLFGEVHALVACRNPVTLVM